MELKKGRSYYMDKKKLIYPKAYFKNVQQITIHFLIKNKIKALILDVDNTLIDYKKKMSKEVEEWSKELQGQGIKMYILSNTNKKEKVKKVANKLEIPYKILAKKPSKKGFNEIQQELKINNENIGVVGDQIFTDVIGGNRCKMFTILIEPIAEKDIWLTKVKRPIEIFIKKKYLKKINKGGDMD